MFGFALVDMTCRIFKRGFVKRKRSKHRFEIPTNRNKMVCVYIYKMVIGVPEKWNVSKSCGTLLFPWEVSHSFSISFGDHPTVILVQQCQPYGLMLHTTQSKMGKCGDGHGGSYGPTFLMIFPAKCSTSLFFYIWGFLELGYLRNPRCIKFIKKTRCIKFIQNPRIVISSMFFMGFFHHDLTTPWDFPATFERDLPVAPTLARAQRWQRWSGRRPRQLPKRPWTPWDFFYGSKPGKSMGFMGKIHV